MITVNNQNKNDITLENKSASIDKTFDSSYPETFNDNESDTFNKQTALVQNQSKNNISLNTPSK